MHDQETDVVMQGSHVRDRGVDISLRVVLRGMHITFSIDRIWK